MPARSKAQYGFMAAVAAGKAKGNGLTKSQAREFMAATRSYKSLPRKKKG